MKIIHRLASLRLTLPGMLALAAGVLISYRDVSASTAWLAIPLCFLAVNLFAAVLVNPRFRCQPALLVFHLCLLAVVLLATYSHLSSLQGRVEITEGQAFSAAAVEVVRKGPWHPRQRLDSVDFVQGPLRIEYAPGLKRGRTASQLGISAVTSGGTVTTIGDNTPLQQAGYRIYTTSNKGYSAILTWIGNDGSRQTGAINFPSYPLNDWNQTNQWTGPAGNHLGLELNLPPSHSFDRHWVLDGTPADTALTVMADGQRVRLAPGEALQLENGRLLFDEIRLWMGYRITYVVLLPWLFSAALVGVLALAWQFLARFYLRPLPVVHEQRESAEDSDVITVART
jgi:cytochrome c biogenesis protein